MAYYILFNYKNDNKYIDYIKNLDKSHYLIIEPKENIKDLDKYIKEINIDKKNIIKYINKKDEWTLYKLIYNIYSSYSNYSFILKYDHNNLYNKILQKYFIEYTRRFFIKEKNEIIEVKIHSAIKKEEGKVITTLIKKYKLKKCLEIGMAFGISASYILLANRNVNLISIDPNQTNKSQWNSMGLKLLKELDVNERHHLISEKSYISLSKLLNTYGEEYFDFIFIDGWHTFDYTLIDFFMQINY